MGFSWLRVIVLKVSAQSWPVFVGFSWDFLGPTKNWEPARPLQRSLGPSGPEMPKESRKCLPSPPAAGPQKVSKRSRGQSGKSPESLRKVSGECFWSVLGLFGDFLGSRRRRPRKTFSRLFRHFGPGGPERPL